MNKYCCKITVGMLNLYETILYVYSVCSITNYNRLFDNHHDASSLARSNHGKCSCKRATNRCLIH